MIHYKYVLYLLVFIFTFLNGNDSKKVSLQLQWKYQFQFAGYIMAKEKGFYQDAGLDVEIKEWKSGINMVEEVINQTSQYAVVRPTSMIDISNDKKIVYLAAIFQSSPLILLADKSSGILSVKDFKNKTMMTTGDLNTDTSLISMMFSQGIKISDMNVIKPSFNPADLINGKTDLMASYISNEPFVLKELGGEPVIFSPKDYGFDFYNDLIIADLKYSNENSSEVNRFKEATIKGWEYAFENIDETVDMIYSKYNTQNKSKKALKYEGETLKTLAYFQTNNLGKIEIAKLEKIYEVYKLLGLVKKDIDFNKVVFNKVLKDIDLSEKEKAYLANKKYISMCIDPSWMPFERFNQNGEYEGMSADYYEIFEKHLGIKFDVVKTSTWSETLEFAQKRKCDILSLVMSTPEREKYLNFTTPYLKVPLVVATRMDIPFINEIKDLKGRKIGIPKGYAFVELLKNKYPFLDIVEVLNVDEGLEKVRKKELFGYVGTLASVGYLLQSKYSGELKIAGKVEQNWELGIGVRNDDALLLSIMQKAVNGISSDDRQKILNKWISVKFEQGVDYSLTWKVVLIFSSVILVLLFFYFKLQGLKNKLLEQKNEFETIFKNSKDGIAILDLESRFLNCNEEYLNITGFSLEELRKTSCIELTDPQEREKSIKVIEEVINKGYVKNFEKTCLLKEGRRIIINMSLSLMPDKKRILISTKDITQLKQLESQTKLASMGEMLGNIAHQWRQPLSVISTAATGMKLKKEMGMLEDDEFYASCDHINDNAQYLSQTIDDFKNFIKGDTRPVKFSIEKDIESFMKLVNSSIKKYNINLVLDLDSNLVLTGYPNELIQCFINIFNNSKDAFLQNNIPEEGRYVFISDKKAGKHLEIIIKDNAGGIPEKIIKKIFDPYFTTKHQQKGTGLGLHMTYNLISTSMKGTIEAVNEQYEYNGKEYTGAKFVIRLPLS